MSNPLTPFVDQLEREVLIPFPPKRIVSLVPSQTELLFDLGLHDQLVGVTKFCVHPESARRKTIIGGTKNYRFEVIDALQPDLIIGNKEENDQEGITRLATKWPVWLSDIGSIEDAYQMMLALGELTNTTEKSNYLVANIQQGMGTLKGRFRANVAYFIWMKPLMVAARGTFIHELLSHMGFENVFADASRYPEVSESVLRQYQPEVVLLSSEPYPFKPQHIAFFHGVLPKARVMLVDGERFSWYGSRMLHLPKYVEFLFRDFDTHLR